MCVYLLARYVALVFRALSFYIFYESRVHVVLKRTVLVFKYYLGGTSAGTTTLTDRIVVNISPRSDFLLDLNVLTSLL